MKFESEFYHSRADPGFEVRGGANGLEIDLKCNIYISNTIYLCISNTIQIRFLVLVQYCNKKSYLEKF